MIAGFDRITDVHIHIQPWRELKPAVLDVMWRGEAAAQRDRLIQLMEDPRALLEVMDRAGVWRGGVERALPVMIHTGTSIFPGARSKFGNPMELDDVAIDFPNLAIVMAHGGRPLYMEEAFFILRRHPRVWLDVSGIPPARLLEYFPRLPEVADRVGGAPLVRQRSPRSLLNRSTGEPIAPSRPIDLFSPTSATITAEHGLDVKRGEFSAPRPVGPPHGEVKIIPVGRTLPRGT